MTGDERLVVLEAKVAEEARKSDGLSAHLQKLEEKLDWRFDALDQKLDKLATAFDGKLEKQSSIFDQKLDKLDKRVESDIKTLSLKIDSNFKWLVGINITMWATAVGAIIVVAGLILAR